MNFMKPKFFLSFLIILFNYSYQEEKLRWAFELFRHGARTPYDGLSYNFYDCFSKKWEGLKELTGVGLRQHFLVGYRNRLKYMIENNLIKEVYDPREVYLISTDTNRTIMSAYAQAQGLYLPETGPILTPEQAKVAIPPVEEGIFDEEKAKLDNYNYTALPHKMNIMPVHTFFNKEHFFQLMDKKVCPKASSIYTANKNREEVINFLNEMNGKYGKNLVKILYEKDENALKNYTKAYYIFDTIIAHYTEGNSFYSSILSNLNVTSDELLKDCFQFFEYDLLGNGINNDEELCLHSMSPVFDRLIQWMDLKIKKDKEGQEDYTEYDLPKFVMFSAHDSTCGAFMGFMKALFKTPIKYPFFATNINLELIRKGDIKNENYYFVRYIINDDDIDEIEYTKFKENVNKKRKSREQIDIFCGFTEEKKPTLVYLIANITLSVISIILIILIFITIKKKKKVSSNIDLDKLESLNEFNDS